MPSNEHACAHGNEDKEQHDKERDAVIKRPAAVTAVSRSSRVHNGRASLMTHRSCARVPDNDNLSVSDGCHGNSSGSGRHAAGRA